MEYLIEIQVILILILKSNSIIQKPLKSTFDFFKGSILSNFELIEIIQDSTTAQNLSPNGVRLACSLIKFTLLAEKFSLDMTGRSLVKIL